MLTDWDLQAPFMATFKVRKERVEVVKDLESEMDEARETRVEYDVWVQAIFKVGDDCRQDVLALQVIAMFKNIFMGIGLTLYLFPYRVTATAPGVSLQSPLLSMPLMLMWARREVWCHRRGAERDVAR